MIHEFKPLAMTCESIEEESSQGSSDQSESDQSDESVIEPTITLSIPHAKKQQQTLEEVTDKTPSLTPVKLKS